MKTRIKNFFGSKRQYAVSGSSTDPNKFGYKVTAWYVNHSLPVIPVNPKTPEILGQQVVSSLLTVIKHVNQKADIGSHKLGDVDGLSVSFLTPPHITSATLKQIADIDGYKDVIKGLWFQPGSYDKDVLETAEKIGLGDKVIEEDECILVRGEEGLYSASL